MTWNKATAKTEIQKFFRRNARSINKISFPSESGKIYELYCLAETINWIKQNYNAIIIFHGKTIDFKASTGNIDLSRSYFEIMASGHSLEMHLNIEVQTLGSAFRQNVSDYSGYHEIDLVLIDPGVRDREIPRHDQLFLGVECKSQANFTKSISKQVLGIRREISLFHKYEHCSIDILFNNNNIKLINADPAYLYWLVFTDPKGLRYSQSPAVFGIEFKHWSP